MCDVHSKVDIFFYCMSKSSINAAGDTAITIAPVQASPANDAPEFVDAAGLQSRFGIKRSLAYQLLADNAIEGVSLRRRGRVRGKRLFAVDSVRAFIRTQMQAENQ
jgi:hypothetical protein